MNSGSKQKVICITGSTDGIGLAAARRFAHGGSKIILHGRSNERLQAARKEMTTIAGNPNVSAVQADFSSLAEVKVMAEVLLEEQRQIDVLINNAGLYSRQRVLTVDGFETTFAVNHLAHFYLTLLLEPVLLASGARIINVSSVDHLSAGFDAGNMQGEQRYSGYDAYAFSKLCNVMFTLEHAERLRGTGVTVNTLDPGVLATKLLHAGWSLSGQDPVYGGDALVRLALSEKIESITGCYFENNRPASCSALAEDPELRRQLWNISEEMVGRTDK